MKKALYIVLIAIIIGLVYLKWQSRNQIETYIPSPSPSVAINSSPEPMLEPTPGATATPSLAPSRLASPSATPTE